MCFTVSQNSHIFLMNEIGGEEGLLEDPADSLAFEWTECVEHFCIIFPFLYLRSWSFQPWPSFYPSTSWEIF